MSLSAYCRLGHRLERDPRKPPWDTNARKANPTCRGQLCHFPVLQHAEARYCPENPMVESKSPASTRLRRRRGAAFLWQDLVEILTQDGAWLLKAMNAKYGCDRAKPSP